MSRSCRPGHLIPKDWRNDGLACIRRAAHAIERDLCRFPLRRPLGLLPVPLRSTDAPVMLDLQAIHDQCYRQGRYDRIDYTVDPAPPLSSEDAAWANDLLKSAGKR